MNTRSKSLSIVAAPLMLLTAAWLYAGPLNPPVGPITSTYKTLGEVEPRIAIGIVNTPGDATSLYKITQPGCYYFTGNITGVTGKHGIKVASHNVTIDLNGFLLLGVPGSLHGVATEGVRDHIAIGRGNVIGWGGSGIALLEGGSGSNSFLADVNASSNTVDGISANTNAIIKDCVAQGNGARGISARANATVSGCVARNNGTSGFQDIGVSSFENCIATGNGSHGFWVVESSLVNCHSQGNTGAGVLATSGSMISHCRVANNSSVGIYMGDSISTGVGSVSDCVVLENSPSGIRVSSGVTVERNTCSLNGVGTSVGAGIFISGQGNRIEGNNCYFNNTGIQALTSNNVIVRNVCADNTANNWNIAGGNTILVVQSNTSAAVVGNSGGVAPGSTDPSANFTY